MFFSKTRDEKLNKMQQKRMAYLEQLALIRQFKKDDEGGLIILTLLLLISMLVVGGMAVDFMRFESERTKLQSVSDRAVLAAANLNQNRDAAAVINEFFVAEGYPDAIIGQPDINKNASGSTITLNSQIDVNTFYLRLIGMDTLSAPATASAIEGTGDVEVSLILDISGSMRNEMTGPIYQRDSDGNPIRDADGQIVTVDGTGSRMFFLQQAANQFIADLLLPEYEDRVSINLIAYSQHVSIGDDLYYAIRTTPDSITQIDPTTGTSIIGSSYSELDDDGAARLGGSSGVISDDYLADDGSLAVNYDWAGGLDVFTNPSRCVTFTDEDYNTLEFDADRIYQQVELVDFYSTGETFQQNRIPCPAEDFQSIIVMSQDVEELQGAISQYIPTLNTSIYRGMKWGSALLDPSMRDLIDRIPTVDSAFRGSRPADYGTGSTSKYIVIMTDGQTVTSERILPGNYDEYDERVGLAAQSAYFYARNDGDSSTTAYWNNGRVNNMTESIGTVAQLNTKLSQICDLAGDAVTEVYTISMGINNATMTDCASKPGNALHLDYNERSGRTRLGRNFRKNRGPDHRASSELVKDSPK